jgi:hypothetical protein
MCLLGLLLLPKTSLSQMGRLEKVFFTVLAMFQRNIEMPPSGFGISRVFGSLNKAAAATQSGRIKFLYNDLNFLVIIKSLANAFYLRKIIKIRHSEDNTHGPISPSFYQAMDRLIEIFLNK